MINRFLVIILMLFLIPFSAIYGQDANVDLSDSYVDDTLFSPVRIGYTPQQLYDANVGTPIFVKGESIWVYPDFTSFIVLRNPMGNIVAFSSASSAPRLLYTFEDHDDPGKWSIYFTNVVDGVDPRYALNVTPNFIYSITLADTRMEVNDYSIDYGIEDQQLNVNGSINLDISSIPTSTTVFIANREPFNTTTIPSDIFLETSQIFLDISNIPDADSLISISMYIPAFSSSVPYDGGNYIDAKVWAEIHQEVPLSKQSDQSIMINYVDELISTTPKVLAQINEETNSHLQIKIPKPEKSEDNWPLPIKYGRAELSVYIENSNIIHITRIPILILPDIVVVNPIALESLDQYQNTIRYSLSYVPENYDQYNVILVTKLNGVDSFWTMELNPPLHTLSVINDFDNSFVENYEITLENLESFKVEEKTFTLVDRDLQFVDIPINVDYTLKINSFIVDSTNSNSQKLTLNQNLITELTTKQSNVIFDINDLFGLAPDGIISIQKLDNLNFDNRLLLDWTGNETITNLPLGIYRAEIIIGDYEEFIEFEVHEANTIVEVNIDTIYGLSKMNLFVGLSFVILLEVILGYFIWKRALYF